MIRHGIYNMLLEKGVLYLRTTLLRDVTGLLLDASCFVSSACHTIYRMYILYFVQLYLVLDVNFLEFISCFWILESDID